MHRLKIMCVMYTCVYLDISFQFFLEMTKKAGNSAQQLATALVASIATTTKSLPLCRRAVTDIYRPNKNAALAQRRRTIRCLRSIIILIRLKQLHGEKFGAFAADVVCTSMSIYCISNPAWSYTVHVHIIHICSFFSSLPYRSRSSQIPFPATF